MHRQALTLTPSPNIVYGCVKQLAFTQLQITIPDLITTSYFCQITFLFYDKINKENLADS